MFNTDTVKVELQVFLEFCEYSIAGAVEKGKITVAQFTNILDGVGGFMPAPTLAPSSKLKGTRILIADENPATLEFFTRLLGDRGFTTMTADSGEAVLRFLSGELMEDDEL